VTQPADPAPWLPLPSDLAALAEPQATDAQRARLAAAAYVERVRKDLFDEAGVYTPNQDVVQAGLLLTSRLYARRSTPQGLASFGEFGPGTILRGDPDVDRLLGLGRHAPPKVG
jgi:hypothetical protein